MEDKNYFSSNLKFLRRKFDETQLELAEFLGRKRGLFVHIVHRLVSLDKDK